MRIDNLILSVLVSFVFFACSKEVGTVTTEEEYLKWLNSEENGLIRTRYVNGLEIRVKYLPAQYLAYQELMAMPGYKAHHRDSIIKLYQDNLTFVMSIGPDERKEAGGDIMLTNVSEYKEYAERTYNMNFVMEEFVSLNVNDKDYRPVLSAMENIYGLDSKRNIMFVFVPSDKEGNNFKKASKFDFVYRDEMFDLGTNHFVFLKKDIDKIPAFPFTDSVN